MWFIGGQFSKKNNVINKKKKFLYIDWRHKVITYINSWSQYHSLVRNIYILKKKINGHNFTIYYFKSIIFFQKSTKQSIRSFVLFVEYFCFMVEVKFPCTLKICLAKLNIHDTFYYYFNNKNTALKKALSIIFCSSWILWI